jgi:hypothetical protein
LPWTRCNLLSPIPCCIERRADSRCISLWRLCMADKQRPRVCAKQGGGLSTRTERRRRHDSKAVYACQKFRNSVVKILLPFDFCVLILLRPGRRGATPAEVTVTHRHRDWHHHNDHASYEAHRGRSHSSFRLGKGQPGLNSDDSNGLRRPSPGARIPSPLIPRLTRTVTAAAGPGAVPCPARR